MKITESIQTEVKYQFDVLVVGGGVAGIAAAFAAARRGAKVGLVEKQFLLGGLATAGIVTIYLPLCDGMGHQVSYGLAEELLRLSIRDGWEKDYPTAWLEGGTLEQKRDKRFEVRFNPQLFAIAVEQQLLREGVEILYGSSACNVITENNRITHIIVENKSGRAAIAVQTVVDATGDADICVMAGEQTALFQQKNVLASWYYSTGLQGYDLKMLGFADIPDEHKTEEHRREDNKSKRFQGIDADEISQMVQLSHASVLTDVKKKRQTDNTYFPVTIATIPQLRMTRRLVGCSTVCQHTPSDLWSDSIGIIGNWRTRGPAYEIPFSCLHGNRIRNLVTAGRCISAEDTMWDLTRVIPACAITGEAAGTAAACWKDFGTVDIPVLQNMLREAGGKVFLKEFPWSE